MAHILIIDDDEAFRSMLRRTLEREGHTVTEADEGAAGLRAVAAATVDLVITDIVMPGMEGLETIQHLRRQHPRLEIIAISGGGRMEPDGYLKAAKLFGAVSVLSKPFERQELLDAIESALKAGC